MRRETSSMSLKAELGLALRHKTRGRRLGNINPNININPLIYTIQF